MRRRRLALLVVACLACSTPRCGDEQDGHGLGAGAGQAALRLDTEALLTGAAPGEVLARAGTVTVTAGDVAAHLRVAGALARKRFEASLEEKQKVVEELLRRRLMVAEAKKRALHRDPAFRLQAEQLLVSRLLEDLRRSLVEPRSITEAAVDEELGRYDRGVPASDRPTVRAAVIVTRSAAAARQALAAARTRPGDLPHFVELVRRHSVDETTRAAGGDLGYFAADDARVDARIRQEVFRIKPLWGLSGVIAGEDGRTFSIVMKTGSRPALSGLQAGRRKAARRRLLQRRRAEALARYMAGLGAGARSQVDLERLKALQLVARGGDPR